jgi:ribose/xylose/arabinose/galactoside ABC-type transport system permease subunit
MLGLIAALLVILWLMGYVNPTAAISSWLPILAVIAVVIGAIRLITGRHAY